MARVTHPDTFTCDLCGRQLAEGDMTHLDNVPVLFTTEQTEGRQVTPYVEQVPLDLCHDCVDHLVNVYAIGAMGYNKYYWREGRQ